MNLGLVFKEV